MTTEELKQLAVIKTAVDALYALQPAATPVPNFGPFGDMSMSGTSVAPKPPVDPDGPLLDANGRFRWVTAMLWRQYPWEQMQQYTDLYPYQVQALATSKYAETKFWPGLYGSRGWMFRDSLPAEIRAFLNI